MWILGRAGGPCKVEIVADCDHFYNGKEGQVAGIVSGWLAQTLGLPRGTRAEKA